MGPEGQGNPESSGQEQEPRVDTTRISDKLVSFRASLERNRQQAENPSNQVPPYYQSLLKGLNSEIIDAINQAVQIDQDIASCNENGTISKDNYRRLHENVTNLEGSVRAQQEKINEIIGIAERINSAESRLDFEKNALLDELIELKKAAIVVSNELSNRTRPGDPNQDSTQIIRAQHVFTKIQKLIAIIRPLDAVNNSQALREAMRQAQALIPEFQAELDELRKLFGETEATAEAETAEAADTEDEEPKKEKRDSRKWWQRNHQDDQQQNQAEDQGQNDQQGYHDGQGQSRQEQQDRQWQQEAQAEAEREANRERKRAQRQNQSWRFILGFSQTGANFATELAMSQRIEEALAEVRVETPTAQQMDEVVTVLSRFIISKNIVTAEEAKRDNLDPSAVIERAVTERDQNLDTLLRTAVTAYIAHKLTDELRQKAAINLSSAEAAMRTDTSHDQARIWLTLSTLSSSVMATILRTQASHLIQTDTTPAGRILAAGLNFTASASSTFITKMAGRGLNRLGNIEEQFNQAKKMQDQENMTPEVARQLYEKQWAELNNLLESGRLKGKELEAFDLASQIAEAKTAIEINRGIQGTEAFEGQTTAEVAARAFARVQAMTEAAREHNQALQTITNKRASELTGRAVASDFYASLRWGALGGALGYTYPELNVVPGGGFTLTPAAAHYMVKRGWQWLSHHQAERQQPIDAEQAREIEKTPGAPFIVLPPIDLNMFYVDRVVGTAQAQELQDKIKAAHAKKPMEKHQLEVERNALIAQLIQPQNGPHGYFFFGKKKNKENNDEVFLARLRTLKTKSNNTAVNPDPSQWPQYQEPRLPAGMNEMRFGKFRAIRFDPTSMYHETVEPDPTKGQLNYRYAPIPQTKGDEFKNSWNLPPMVWVPLDHAEHQYSADQIFTQGAGNVRQQVMIRPDLIGRCCFEIAQGLDPDKLIQAMIDEQHNPQITLDQIIAKARGRK